MLVGIVEKVGKETFCNWQRKSAIILEKPLKVLLLVCLQLKKFFYYINHDLMTILHKLPWHGKMLLFDFIKSLDDIYF
jgi:hypothetical protein